jgi:hypothetical protein
VTPVSSVLLITIAIQCVIPIRDALLIRNAKQVGVSRFLNNTGLRIILQCSNADWRLIQAVIT